VSQLVTDKPGERPVVWEWLSRRTNLPWSSDLRVIGVAREDGSLAAAVGFNAWTPKACWMHVAFDTPHSLSRKLLQAAFSYPFLEHGAEAVYGLTPRNLEAAVRLNKHLGMSPVYETVDCVLFELRREDCRYLKEIH
jgi:hypothetical protein